MTDDELIRLLRFLFFRFMGSVPDTTLLQSAIEDWRRSLS